jgi:GH24 family phage-related lysozyme (muramidase)
MGSFILTIEGFNNNVDGTTTSNDLKLENNEIEGFEFDYDLKNSNNASGAIDNRILKIYGNIDNVLDYDRNIMHLLRRWSKHQIGGTESYSLHDEFYKKVKVEFIHKGLTVRSIELSRASLYSYEENVNASGINNKFILAVKQIDNDKTNIIIDGKKLEYTQNTVISDLVGQTRYPNKEIKLYEDKGFGTLMVIPLGVPLKLLSGREKDSNGNTWIKVDYNGQVGWVDCINLAENEPTTNASGVDNMLTPDDMGSGDKVSPTSASDKLVTFLKSYEGFHDMPYRGLDSQNRTVGYGHVINENAEGTRYNNGITEEEATELLKSDLNRVVYQYLNPWISNVSITLNQQQYDALVSFTFNVGPSWITKYEDLKNILMSGNITHETMHTEFMDWIKVNGERALGLYRRRIDELNIFFEGNYSRNYPNRPDWF